jgi:hypothetical protein
MIKIRLIGGEELAESLGLLLPEIGAELCACPSCNPDLTVTVKNAEEDILLVEKKGDAATLTYGGGKARAHRGFAQLVSAAKEKKDIATEEHPAFRQNGAMVDVSRANVLNLDTVKFMMRKMALMGQNMLMLYTEDILEVKTRPYFGYMRGRYTVEEIRELDAYAISLGIELIPCLELLSHMSAVLQWPAAGAYRDTHWTLNVGKKETYDFIADVLDAITSCFSSKKIHIGFDESDDLGLGSHLREFGYETKEALFFPHLKRVCDLARERGLAPMIWSDMPFHFYGEHLPNFRAYDDRVVLPDDIDEKFAGARPVFWAYGDRGEESFDHLLDEHKKIPGDTMFAGGVWIWSGFAPNYDISKKATISALRSCIRKGVKDVMATVWTNGSEGSSMLTLPGMAWFADMDYTGDFNEDGVRKTFADATGGLCYDDFMLLEALEHPSEKAFCATRALCYNDPMIPLVDAHIPADGFGKHYETATASIRAVSDKQGAFTPAFKILELLSELLEIKSDFGIRLKKAYDEKDAAAMKEMAALCDTVIERVKRLKEAHKKAHFAYNKPFGWELHDMRYGMLENRFATTKERITAYLTGEAKSLEELEQERLPYVPDKEGDPEKVFMWVRQRQIASPSMALPI